MIIQTTNLARKQATSVFHEDRQCLGGLYSPRRDMIKNNMFARLRAETNNQTSRIRGWFIETQRQSTTSDAKTSTKL